MTSDAKIGLLLGLVFIFMIAFLINGLPNFRDGTNNNELTTNTVNFEADSPGLAARERKAQEAFDWKELLEKRSSDPEDKQDIRSVIPLPKSASVVKVSEESAEVKPKTSPEPSLLITAKKTKVSKPEPAEPVLSKVYVVSEGDNLADIAKKFYGPEEGNKKINITRIFEANRKLLRSPDEILVGQKLIIPSLSTPDKNKGRSVLSNSMFGRVESIGRKQPSLSGHGTKQSGWYVVRKGDSLWKIAAAQLGSGSRYTEISKLNANVLDDEDNLVIGMRLRMPAR